jgi:hypothetical protein
MYQRRFEGFTDCFTIAVVASDAVAAGSGESGRRETASEPALQANKNMAGENVAELNPFGHVAYLPSGAKLSSIRFESVRAVKAAPSRTSNLDSPYCESLSEPGGSMHCPLTRYKHSVAAYRATYSYEGPPLTSDEYGATGFTFSIYFRPEEFVASMRLLLASRKVRRSEAAAIFSVTTSRETPPQSWLGKPNSLYVMVRVDPGGLAARTRQPSGQAWRSHSFAATQVLATQPRTMPNSIGR